tara:strand:+ start:178 stop:729 length:552 start_codon:yes stop_codon:yes gene_type:complete
MQIHPHNTFWLEEKVDESMMSYIRSQIKLAKLDYKHELVGHISSSLQLPDVENKLSNYVLDVAKQLNYLYTPDLEMKKTWVNFQKKYEFNPVHYHGGTISFVIWVKVPYTYEDECKVDSVRNRERPCAGCFEFLHTNTLGQIKKTLYPPTENILLVFPSTLSHCVYPFYTSDEERISISGNID